MKSLSLVFILCLSFNVLAGTQYKLVSAKCDNAPVDISSGAEEFSMIFDFFTETTASLNMFFKQSADGMSFTADIKSPLLLEATTSDRYIMKENGPVSCTIVYMGQSQDCSEDTESTFPQGEFSMVRNEKTLNLTFFNYTDEDMSCNEFSLKLNRI